MIDLINSYYLKIGNNYQKENSIITVIYLFSKKSFFILEKSNYQIFKLKIEEKIIFDCFLLKSNKRILIKIMIIDHNFSSS